ncbi:MAG: radical SAM protein [Planctomycetes bacterium]|nr:radical SAM protein [Planctomycetota bacterium]
MSAEPAHADCPAPPLRLVFWESTSRCNLQCVHCRRLDDGRDKSNDELGTDEARLMIDDLGDHWPGLILVFSGGEPLLRDDVFDLARAARGRGLVAALATNGTLVTEAVARRVVDAGFNRVSVSLDGARAATHDAIRGASGAFDAAMRGLRLLRDAGAAVQINMSVARRNAAELDQMFDLAQAEGVAALHIFIVVPVGCGIVLGEQDRLSPGGYEHLLRQFYYRSIASSLETKATCAPQYARVVEQLRPKDRSAAEALQGGRPSAGGGCLAGTGVCFVSHRGQVFPCGYLPVSCGNVRVSPLSRIWTTSDVFVRLRDRGQLGGKCGQCGYAVACGGCRARAFAATGDWMGEEPDCIYLPRV